MIRFANIIKAHWVASTAAILVTITLLSLLPLAQLPPAPGTDKIHHLIAYALLMLPTALRKPDRWVLLGLLFVAYSGAIELLQPYVNRYGEWMDMLANTVGIACGVIAAVLIDFLTPSKHDVTPDLLKGEAKTSGISE
jgi:VanZ family protein